MARYIVVEVRNTISSENCKEYGLNIKPGEMIPRAAVFSALKKYAKEVRPSIKLDDTDWDTVEEENGGRAWELYFSERAWFNIRHCSEEIDDPALFLEDLDLTPFFECEIYEIYNCEFTTRKPAKVSIKGEFTTNLVLEDDDEEVEPDKYWNISFRPYFVL